MNEYTLESFINFCDEMQIAEEGFGLKNVGNLIKAAIQALGNLILKISNFIREKLSGNGTVFITKEAYELYNQLTKFWYDSESLNQSDNEDFKKICNKIKNIEINNKNLASMKKIDDSQFKSFLSSVTSELNAKRKDLEKLNKEIEYLNKQIEKEDSKYAAMKDLYDNGDAYTKNQIHINHSQTFSGDRMHDTRTNYMNHVGKLNSNATNTYRLNLSAAKRNIDTVNSCITFCNEIIAIINYIRDNGHHVVKK